MRPTFSTNVQTNEQAYRTDPATFDLLNGIFSFTVDAFADDDNALCPRFWTEEDDALTQDWTGEVVFCNPPFRHARHVCAKAGEAKTAVAILPVSAFVTHYWYDSPAPTLILPRKKLTFRSPVDGRVLDFPCLLAAWGANADQRRRLAIVADVVVYGRELLREEGI